MSDLFLNFNKLEFGNIIFYFPKKEFFFRLVIKYLKRQVKENTLFRIFLLILFLGK